MRDDSELWADLGLEELERRPFKRCVLHIGTEKTGTTSLQNFLGQNRQALIKAGCFVPASLSPYGLAANHERLTTYALADSKLADDLRVSAHVQTKAEVVAHRASVAQEFRDEIAELTTADTQGLLLLLSNEHCQSRLIEHAEVRRLKAFLAEFVDEVKVVVYLRPQHDLAVSLYDQALKTGYADIGVLPDFTPGTKRWVGRNYFDYDDLLTRWADVFGPDNIDVRIFARNEMTNGSIIDDMLVGLGIDPTGMEFDRNSNVSMSVERQRALNAINRVAKESGKPLPQELRSSLINQFQQTSHGGGRRPLRAEAEAFYRSFTLSNERVRAAFLPQRETLFKPDFSGFPETVAEEPEVDALVATVLAQQKTINALRLKLEQP